MHLDRWVRIPEREDFATVLFVSLSGLDVSLWLLTKHFFDEAILLVMM